MSFVRPNVIVLENDIPDVFPERLELYGRRLVTSFKKEELLGLAKRVWENEAEVHPIYAISLVEVKELKLGKDLSFSAVSEAYLLSHKTR